MPKAGLAMLLASCCAALWGQQGAMEAAGDARGLPVEWPAGPPRELMPEWARPGAIRFARWDGGRIETAKAFLSGWPGFNPPAPDFVDSMTNWYTPQTIGLLAEARVNAIWVTFSNGFSIASERAHMEQLKRYIELCHRRGIRVLAYQSIANLFWEDMFEREPRSKDWVRLGADGKPTPYAAAAYARMGRTTRYMARIPHPGWQEYLLRRVELALEAGADGVFYDNNFNEGLAETYQRVYRYAASRKRGFILSGNFHPSTYALNRLTNVISTEDGYEPGIYAPANAGGRLAKQREPLLETVGGYLVNNIGLFRMLSGLSEGWKPVMVEHGHRETGERFSNPMSAARHQLAIAEAAASGGSLELFSEGAFADGLYRGKPEAMEIWRAIGRYHRFLEDNQPLYTGVRSAAPLALIVDDSGEGVPLLNGLAARNLLFDVVFEHDITAERLRPYRALAVLGRGVRERAWSALRERAARGTRLIGQPDTASAERLAAALREASGAAPARLDAPPGVVYTVSVQPAARRLLVHLLNYAREPREAVKVTVAGDCRGISLLSPDGARERGFRATPAAASCTVEVALLETYSLLVFEERQP